MPTHPETFDAWTAGAQRVWQAACDWAVSRSDSVISCEHLLWGLLTVESRAADRLQKMNVSQEAFLATWTAKTTAEPATSTELIPHELLDAVFIEARTAAYQANTDVGSEHLLAGLCGVPSDVATWLAQFGLTAGHSPATSSEPPEIVTTPELQVAWLDPRSMDLFETYRILDAAANRAREGFRVVEDYVRWAENDGFLSQQLKVCRHELTEILRRLPTNQLLAARDTPHDVGAEIRTVSEYRRESPAAVATASLKRIEEALRSLEEYSKVVDADLSPRFEQLRYRMYTLEKAIQTTSNNRLRLADHRLCLLATSSLCHHGLGPAVLGALKAGVRLIQLREKSLSDRELIDLARHVRQWTNDFEAIFIVNDRPDIAALVDADGVHLGQDDLDVASARKILGGDKLIGVSTHSIEQARQAVLDGADYLGVGPVFPSSTKSFAEFPGLNYVRQVAAEISLPWFAIGGINEENVSALRLAGATRIAVSSAICSAESSEWAARELLYRLNS